MDSSEGKGRLIDQARIARLRKRKKLNSPDNHTNDIPQIQTGRKPEIDCTQSASEAEYRATLDAMRDAIHVVDRDLRVVLINEKLRKWSQELGLDISNAVGHTVFEMFPFLSEKVKEEYDKVFGEGNVVNTEESQNIAGRQVFTETRKLPIFESGKVEKVVTIVRDITERKRADEALRESESHYRAVVENAGEGIVVVQDGRLQFFNPYVEVVFGRTQEELKSRPFIEFVHPDDRDWVMDIHIRRFKGEEVPPVYEFRVIGVNGNTRWAENNGLLIEWCGRPATLNFLRDITDRKRAQDALRASKEFAENLIETANTLVVVLDCEGTINIFNKFAEELTGYAKEAVLGRNWFEIFIPESERPAIREIHAAVLEGKAEATSRENVILTSEGEQRIIRWNNSPFNDLEGKATGTIAIGIDITDRKQAEEAIQRERDRAQSYLDIAAVMMIAIGADQKVSLANRKACEVLGGQEQDIVGKNWFDHFLPEKIKDKTKVVFNELIAGKSELREYAENQVLTLQGEEKLIAWHNTVIRDVAGNIIGTLSSGEDITERKKAEEELARQRYYLARAQEIGSVGTWELDLTRNKLIWTDENYKIFGLPQGMELTYETFLNCVYPEDREYVDSKWKAAINGEPYDIEHRVLVDGKVKWVREKADLEFDEQGNCIRGTGFTQDITLHRQAEQTLRDSEEKFRQLVENINEVFWLQDVETSQILFVSPAYESIWGQSRQCLYENPNNWIESIHPEDCQRVADAFAAGRMEGPYCQEYRIVRPDGSIRWIWDRSFPIHGHDGRIERIAGIAEDITKRKEAEEQLRESQERFRHAFENANVGMCIVDTNGIITRVNERMCDIFGYEAEQLQGMSVNDIAHPDDVNISPEFIRRSISGEIESSKFEKRYFHRDGHIVWCQVSSSLVRNTWGEPLYFISHVQDITERKKAQEAIEDRLQFERLLSTISSRFVNLPICEIDRAIEDGLGLVGTFFGVDRVSIGQFVGSEREPRTTHSWLADGCNPELKIQIHTTVFSNISLLLMNEEQFIYEKPEDIPDTWTEEKQLIETTGIKAGLVVALRIGGTLIGAMSINSLYAERKWPPEAAERLRLLGDIFANALERKRVEDALIESETKFKSLAEQSPNMIFINKRGKVVYANKRCEEIMGYSREQFYCPDFDFMSLIAPESQDLIRENFARHLKGEEVEPYDYSIIDKDGRHVEAIIASKLIQYGGETAILGTITDITQRKQAEKALRESEERYRSFVQHFQGIAYRGNMNFLPIFFHGAVEEITGYTEAEFLSENPRWDQVIHPDDLPNFFTKNEYKLHTISNHAFEREYRIMRKDGQTRWVQEVIQNICDESGKPAMVQGTIHDITERKRAEEELRESEKRYRLLVDCASDSIFLSDLNGRFIDVNPAACNSLGRTREELLNLSASDIDLDWPKVKATGFLNDLADGESVTIEGTQQRKNKTTFPVEINLTKIDADGNKVILAVARDITQRRRTEESLRKRAEAALREDKVHVSGIDFEWNHEKGVCTFEKLPAIIMWIDTTLAGLMSGVQAMVGTERFGLALQGEGRKSVEDDWQVISQFSDFRKGFEAIANIAAVAGWGNWKLIEIDTENRQCLFRVWNSWEGLYQKSLGVCWGSGVLAGKLAGYCSMLFKANCWADQSAFIAKGDEFDEFRVHTSTRSIEKEIDNLLATDKATRADMAVALQNLRNEISIRRKIEEELKKSEERMALALQGAELGTWDWNVQTGETTFDRRWAEMLGYKLEEIEPHVSTWEKLVHPDDMPHIQEILNAHLEGKTDFYETEHRMRHKCGKWIWVLDKGRVTDRDTDGKPLRAAGTHLDITNHKQAEQRILENRAQLKSLASKLSLTEERERRRLATDLHDQIGQSLVISKIKLDQLRESSDKELTSALGEVCRCLEQVIQDTRMLTFDLSSPILYELGFEAAVAEWLTDEVKNKYGIYTEFDDDGLPKPLDEDIRALLFRNVRELLINTVKHAKAGKVKVSLRKVDNHINVIVEDDGVGFDPVEVRARAVQRAEFGLFSIRERLEQLGGYLEIESEPGQGSRITMTAPLKSENNS